MSEVLYKKLWIFQAWQAKASRRALWQTKAVTWQQHAQNRDESMVWFTRADTLSSWEHLGILSRASATNNDGIARRTFSCPDLEEYVIISYKAGSTGYAWENRAAFSERRLPPPPPRPLPLFYTSFRTTVTKTKTCEQHEDEMTKRVPWLIFRPR